MTLPRIIKGDNAEPRNTRVYIKKEELQMLKRVIVSILALMVCLGYLSVATAYEAVGVIDGGSITGGSKFDG